MRIKNHKHLISKDNILARKITQGVGYLLLSGLLLAGCATTQGPATSDADSVSVKSSKPQTIADPKDISIGHPQSDLMYQIMLAELASQRGLNDVALKYYMNVLRQNKDPLIASRVVRIASFIDANAEALEAAQIWAAGEPDNADARRILAVLYLRNGEFSAATEVLNKILADEPQNIDRSILHIGMILQREVPNEQAFQIASQLIERHPKSAEGHYIVATLAIDAQHTDEALERVERTLELRPDWTEAVVLRARVLQARGEQNLALSYLKKYLNRHPDENEVRKLYARSLVDAQQLEEARSQFELLAVKLPDDRDALFALAMLSLQFKAYDEAEGYLLQLDRLGQRSPQLVYYLGQIKEQKQAWAEALVWYEQVDQGEYFLDSQLRIAAVLARSQGLDEAIKHLRGLELESKEDQRELMVFEAALLKEHKQYKEAIKVVNSIMGKFGKDPELIYDRALLLERVGKVDEALRDLRFVVSEQPENPSALNALGYTLADRTQNYEEALIYVKKAIQLEPNDPAIMDSMGWVNFRMGNHEVALEYLQKAISVIFDGEVAAHLGEVLWSLGRQQEAKELWGKAKEKYSDNAILVETMGRYLQ